MSDSSAETPISSGAHRQSGAGPLILLGVLMAALVVAGTPWGVGMTPDSMAYAAAAQALVDTLDFLALPPKWPPLLPLLLAAATAISDDVLVGGRWINALAGACNLALAAYLLRRCGAGAIAACCLALLLAVQPGFLHMHLVLWSEPMFLAFALLDVVALERVLSRPGDARWRALLVVACAGAMLTRYAGVFLLLLNAAALLLHDGEGTRVARLRVLLLTSVLPLLPFLAWLAFNASRGAGSLGRSLAWHPPGPAHFADANRVLSGWLHLPRAAGPVVVLVLLAAAIWLVRRSVRGRAERSSMPMIVALYALAYAAFILFSISLLDFQTPLDERILFPLLPIALAVAVACLAAIRRKWLSRVGLAMLVVAFALNVPAGLLFWSISRSEGIGFASHSVRDMYILRWMRQVPANWPLLSNAPELIALHMHRKAGMLPSRFQPNSLRPNAQHDARLRERAGRARLIVYFHSVKWRDYLTTPEELNRLEGYRMIYDDADATAWIREPAPR
ncbi:glycosyltransferase family 39 protein [Arenimonas sp.]|uniref:glycosyltransferase family 39 protein n=1 Tax=Arenimonas sp. TaxID=1872635 RepID=UPI0039E29037